MIPSADLLDRVHHAARLVATRDPAAGGALDALRADTEALAGPRERLARLFTGALIARQGGVAADVGNLYGGAAGPAEMLGAFEALVRDTPLVRFAHHAANAAHLAAIGDVDAVCIVDIGLGLGSQWEPLLRALGDRPGGPPRVRLVGIDLPAPGDDPARDLLAVGARLTEVARASGVPFSFTALPGRVEDVVLPTAAPGERLTFNAAFALHHTGPHARDTTLRRLAATRADAVVLCEPEADHDAPAFPGRVQAATHHYGLVFDVLDRCLGARPDARAVIEGQFFGREIHNVVVGEGAARVERHAPAADWARRMEAAGFQALPTAATGGGIALPEGIDIVALGAATALRVDGDPLVVVSAWSAA